MEEFIEKVKENPCLWDFQHLQYRDMVKKDSLWNTIAVSCGMDSATEAKVLWKRLRDSHREALRRRRLSGGHNLRPWKYEHVMDFLCNNSYQKEHADSLESLAVEEQPINVPTTPAVHIEKTVRSNTLRVFEDRVKKRRRDVILNKKCINSHNDALQELFSSMYKKTKALPKSLQLRVQREVFDAVSRAEEEALCYGEYQEGSSRSCTTRFVKSESQLTDTESVAASRDEDQTSDNELIEGI